MDENRQYQQALNKCMQLCSVKEYCEFDISNLLVKKGIPQKFIESIIEQLKEEKFIGAERYCLSFVNDKFKFQGWGKIKIAYQLQQKNLPENAIQNALNALDTSEYKEKIKYLASQKMQSIKAEPSTLTYEQKSKILRFLNGKGFETDLIFKALEELEDINQ